VLLKPGRLSDEEFEVMKMHTILGAQTLQAAARKHPEAAFTHGNAKSIILKDSEKHFDPAVVEAFLGCEREFLAIQEQFAETAWAA